MSGGAARIGSLRACASAQDWAAIWPFFSAIIRAGGELFECDTDMEEAQVRAMWGATFVNNQLVQTIRQPGTYLRGALEYGWLTLTVLLSLVDLLAFVESIRAHAPDATNHGGVIVAAAIALTLSTGALAVALRAVRGRFDRVAAIWAIAGMLLTFTAVIATLWYLVAAWVSTPL